MSLVALANALLDEPMPRRFHAEPMVRAVELLLAGARSPATPRSSSRTARRVAATARAGRESASDALMSRRLTTPHTPSPRTHLLSNGRYHVMLTNAGVGLQHLPRPGRDPLARGPTRDALGPVLLRPRRRDAAWSGRPATSRSAGRPTTTRSSSPPTRRGSAAATAAIETLLEVTVSPEQRAEVRRVTLTNHDDRPRELELTSYAEVVLGPHGADLAHPAFGKLFLETEWLAGSEALLCRRRPRSADQQPIWAVHVVGRRPVPAALVGDLQYETDRARFLGRGRTPADPAALDPGAALSGTTGAGARPDLQPAPPGPARAGEIAVVAFTTGVADRATRRWPWPTSTTTPAPSPVPSSWPGPTARSSIAHRSWSPEEAHLFQRLASHVIFAGRALRADARDARRQPPGAGRPLAHGISGDRPIVLVADRRDRPSWPWSASS